MVNDFGKTIATFVAMLETRQIAQPKKRNTTYINWKESAPHSEISLPLNSYFCDCESNHRLTTTISFDCVAIPPPLQVLTIISGKILCKHYQS